MNARERTIRNLAVKAIYRAMWLVTIVFPNYNWLNKWRLSGVVVRYLGNLADKVEEPLWEEYWRKAAE